MDVELSIEKWSNLEDPEKVFGNLPNGGMIQQLWISFPDLTSSPRWEYGHFRQH